jgi:hypothetical protein
MWGDRQRITAEATTTQVLEGDDKNWKLVTVHENRHSGLAPVCCLKFLRYPFYETFLMPRVRHSWSSEMLLRCLGTF